MLVRGWSQGLGKDRSSHSDHGAYSADQVEATWSSESAEELCRPAPIIIGITGRQYGITKGLSLEGCDTLQEDGETGSLVYWTVLCDSQGRQGCLPVGFAKRDQSDPQ